MKKIILLQFVCLCSQVLSAQWTTNGTNIYYNTGNVGIGTTSPAGRLAVVGGASVFDHPGGAIRILQTSGTLGSNDLGIWNRAGGGGDVFAIADWNSGNKGLFINTNSGNIGIGTTTPSARIHIVDGNNFIKMGDINGVSTSVIELSDGAPVQIEGYESDLRFKTSGLERLRITSGGNLGIGTADTKGYRLAVNGDAIFTKIKVKQSGSWPDYVFHNNYPLPPLAEIEKYIQQHNHLPDVPSAIEVEKNGLDLGDNQAVLLRKIEEITLYLIEQNKEMEKQEKKLQKQEKIIEQMQAEIIRLKNK